MKLTPIAYLVATTFILVTVAIFAALGLAFNWIFYLTVLGQALLVFTVYKVLKDHYETNKTFEDYYEDHPIERED